MEGSFQLNPNASPFIPRSLSSFADKVPEKAESSSKGGPSAGPSGPLEYEENDMDPLALTKMVFSMFPNVSTDFIDELLKSNDFDINLTVDMLYELNSMDVFDDDAVDINGLHNGQGLPGDAYHRAEVSESSSNLSQDLQSEKSATTSDVKCVLLKFSDMNLNHRDLGLPGDDYRCAEVSESSSNISQNLQNTKSATTPDVKSTLPKLSNINLHHGDLGLPDDDKSSVTTSAAN